MKSRSRYIIRVEAVWRLFCLEIISRRYSSVLVTEYPKSGGTWLGQMLAESMSLEFPRNRFPNIKGNLYHGHYLKSFKNVPIIVLWRDPRDILVSYYFHTVVGHDKSNKSIVSQTRRHLNIKDVYDLKSNLPRYIEYSFTNQKSPKFNWNDFFDYWSNIEEHDLGIVHTSYEMLKEDAKGQIARILLEIERDSSLIDIDSVIEKYSFKSQTNRTPGSQDTKSFLRKGIVGDWKNHFTKECIDIFGCCVGDRMDKYNLLTESFNTLAEHRK